MAIAAVTSVIELLVELFKEQGPQDDRIKKLELSRAEWEAEVAGLIMKADSTLKSASNAESRSRTMLRHAEKHADPFAEESNEAQEGIPPQYAEVSESQGMQPMRVDVAPPNEKELRLRMKYG